MITSNPTEEQFNNWLALWQQYAPTLKPNRRSGIEVIRFIQKKYKVKEIRDQRALLDFAAAIYANGWMRDKLPKGLEPDIHVYRILEEGPGVKLYEEQDEEFRFNGETTVAIAIKHIQEPMPSPREYVDDIPISVEQIVLRCMG